MSRATSAPARDTGIRVTSRIKMDPRDNSLFEHVLVVADREAWEQSELRRSRNWDVVIFGSLVVASQMIFCCG